MKKNTKFTYKHLIVKKRQKQLEYKNIKNFFIRFWSRHL